MYEHNSGGTGESFESMMLRESERVKPIIREQFLKEYILCAGDAEETFDIYCRTFGTSRDKPVRMIILRDSGHGSYEDQFLIRNAVSKCIGEDLLLLSTSIGSLAVFVADVPDEEKIRDDIKKVMLLIKECYKLEAAAIYGRVGALSTIPQMYRTLADGLVYSFYGGRDKILCERDFTDRNDDSAFETGYGEIELAVKNGNAERTKALLNNFFDSLARCRPHPAVAKTYCLELYVCMIRCCKADMMDKYMKGVASVQEPDTLGEIRDFIFERSAEIVKANEPENVVIYSSLIRESVDVIEKNLGNETLSLRWLAKTILYTNVDYLGKLFKKETGKNFSHYVMEKRMEMAKRLIVNGSRDRIYEVAEKVGYGSNSQYFSQVFKKYTGVSPLEYKGFSRLNGKKIS